MESGGAGASGSAGPGVLSVPPKRLLFILAADRHVSPFDVALAHDAGFDAVHLYPEVAPEETRPLTQDLMFARGPKGAAASALFVTTADLARAEAAFRAAREALLDPFRIHLMIDPKGGYTTAAALLAKVEALSRRRGPGDLRGRTVAILGGTGGVGRAAAGMAAAAGARVLLTSRDTARAQAAAREVADLFGAAVESRAASGEKESAALVAEADVVLATGAAGARLLSRASLAGMKGPKVVADVNAVPPSGIEGLEPADQERELAPGVFGIGALAIGALKSKVESSLLRDLATSDKALVIDAAAAGRRAAEIVAASQA
ncbi:MAG TPA: methylene-tetrahydromethanopterin dehydrogenase N-terminal domain-containing protein [Candidatus Polarisedimenticolia bacterium]|nr:methylene-tetrahydromethanopterin dehydrogenase N-terminal domain-containing protein [Candidatus Polarisedimenticolia bacterium]